MDLKKAWSVCAANRSRRILIPMSILLLVSVAWNLRYYQYEQKQRKRANELERASTTATVRNKEQSDLAESERRARNAKTDARVQELYDEINELTRLSERIVLPDRVTRATPPAASRSEDHTLRIR